MRIALSTDHTGFSLLQKIEFFLERGGYECLNFGPELYDPGDDYPDFIKKAAESVSKGECERGIILGGSGQGEAITANRFPGVRCALYYGPATAFDDIDAEGTKPQDEFEILRLSRIHNNSNMLSLASRFLSLADMEKAIAIWMETEFGGTERHARRIEKIDN